MIVQKKKNLTHDVSYLTDVHERCTFQNGKKNSYIVYGSCSLLEVA